MSSIKSLASMMLWPARPVFPLVLVGLMACAFDVAIAFVTAAVSATSASVGFSAIFSVGSDALAAASPAAMMAAIPAARHRVLAASADVAESATSLAVATAAVAASTTAIVPIRSVLEAFLASFCRFFRLNSANREAACDCNDVDDEVKARVSPNALSIRPSSVVDSHASCTLAAPCSLVVPSRFVLSDLLLKDRAESLGQLRVSPSRKDKSALSVGT